LVALLFVSREIHLNRIDKVTDYALDVGGRIGAFDLVTDGIRQ